MKEYTIIISDWTPTPCRPVLSSPSYLPSQRAVWTACPWEVHCFFLPVGRDWTYYFWEQHGDILSLFGPIHAVRDCWACECEDYWALKLVGNCWACWPVMIVRPLKVVRDNHLSLTKSLRNSKCTLVKQLALALRVYRWLSKMDSFESV